MDLKNYYVYIMCNRYNNVLYIGVTNDLARRVEEHKNGEGSSFTTRYNIRKLVYYERYDEIETAIAREKQLKGGSRFKKVQLITKGNPGWLELELE